jgi:hypothetical protein
MRILTGIFLSLLSFMTYAAVGEDAPAVAELPPSDATGLIGFLVVMVAMIGGYAWWIVKKERERKQREGGKS